MKRENTNFLRFILEDIIPPVFRDSFLFKIIIKLIFRNKTLEQLKSNILNISDIEYKKLYKELNRIHQNTDLSKICIDEILKNIKPKSIIDVGCGDGFLLNKIKKKFRKISVTGLEIELSEKEKKKFKNNGIQIINNKIENLDKIKKKYDTVICTHVLEHILDINLAYSNLKKICKKRLIIIIPRERPYEYTFNSHIHFFPYMWSFINTIRPKKKYRIKNLNRDFLYIEDIK